MLVGFFIYRAHIRLAWCRHGQPVKLHGGHDLLGGRLGSLLRLHCSEASRLSLHGLIAFDLPWACSDVFYKPHGLRFEFQ